MKASRFWFPKAKVFWMQLSELILISFAFTCFFKEAMIGNSLQQVCALERLRVRVRDCLLASRTCDRQSSKNESGLRKRNGASFSKKSQWKNPPFIHTFEPDLLHIKWKPCLLLNITQHFCVFVALTIFSFYDPSRGDSLGPAKLP